MNAIEKIRSKILSHALREFKRQQLGTTDLLNGYPGIGLDWLRAACCNRDAGSVVNFDLALEDLEKKRLIATGPLEPYDNPSGCVVYVLGHHTKKEYVYLTGEGYRVAQETRQSINRRLFAAASAAFLAVAAAAGGFDSIKKIRDGICDFSGILCHTDTTKSQPK